MATKAEVAMAVAFVFTAYGREPTEMHVEAWFVMLGQYAQSEIAAACKKLVETSETLPPVGAVIRTMRDARLMANRNMTPATAAGQHIAAEVRRFRAANPQATADEVAAFAGRVEVQVLGGPIVPGVARDAAPPHPGGRLGSS